MNKITFGTRQLNKLLDDTLMVKYQVASETLMELAGLAVAQVAHRILQRQKIPSSDQSVCVLVGPGNNGGDGLVAARHLKMMAYQVELILFKPLQGKNGIYHKFCGLHGINTKWPNDFKEAPGISHNFKQYLNHKNLIIDAVFGFPFEGDIRPPYGDFLSQLGAFEKKTLAVDIPSGWDANLGNIKGLFTPAYLVSLGLPKLCSQSYKGEHYLGGRFVPEEVCKELELTLPTYPGDALFCKL